MSGAGNAGSGGAVLTHDGVVPEFIRPERLDDVWLYDMVDEGVYIIRFHSRHGWTTVPAELVAEWIPEGEHCLLRPSYDYEHQRVLGFDDLPPVLVRGVQPPIRCDLAVAPCERCPRRTR